MPQVMSSAWDAVRASNYSSMKSVENYVDGSIDSPAPDKFKRKTSNSMRMSIRKRLPLRRINTNAQMPSYNGELEKPKENKAAKKGKRSPGQRSKGSKQITAEASLKKTFYKVSEQLTGYTKKRQLKETPQKTTSVMRYREKLRSPPNTPNRCLSVENSPCHFTPISKLKSLKRSVKMQQGETSIRRTPHRACKRESSISSNDFTNHLELIRCGIQHLESNGAKLSNAIGLDSRSPYRMKTRRDDRLWETDARKCVSTRSATNLPTTDAKQSTLPHPSLTRRAFSKTITRMSLRAKHHRPLRSIKSASDLEASCFNGPMTIEPGKLPPLQAIQSVSCNST